MGLPRSAIGTFRAVATRDGNALRRDGQPFYALNHVFDDPRDGPIYEILFSDETWSLAATDDLDIDPTTDVAKFLRRRQESTNPQDRPHG